MKGMVSVGSCRGSGAGNALVRAGAHPENEAHHPDAVDDESARACPSAGSSLGEAHAMAATSFNDARGVKVRDAEGETEQAEECEDFEGV